MDRGAWRVTFHGHKRVGHDLATEQEQYGSSSSLRDCQTFHSARTILYSHQQHVTFTVSPVLQTTLIL